MMKSLNKILLAFLLFQLFTLGAITGKHSKNNRYILRQSKQSIKVFDNSKKELVTIPWKHPPENISVLPDTSFLAIVEKTQYDHDLSFYNIQTTETFFWGSSSKYLLYNDDSQNVIILTTPEEMYIVPLNRLENFFKSRKNNILTQGWLHKLTGHPMGGFYLISITGKYLIYNSGVGGNRVVYFAFDMVNKKNYFIDKCFFNENNCVDIDYTAIFFDKLRHGKLIAVPNKVYPAVMEIIKKQKMRNSKSR